MKKILLLLAFLPVLSAAQKKTKYMENNLPLGAFSVSLNVKNLKASEEFYKKLGFIQMGGNPEHKYLILKNGTTIIGLFEGIIPKNALTFNPGWDENAQNLETFTDVREIQKNLEAKGVKLDTRTDEKTSGPAYITLTDPDGNPILIDQHR